MAISISASVGQNGVNRADDVRIIQSRLNNLPEDEGRPNPLLTVDGVVGPKTIAAIRAFQESHGLTADGRVDPGGKTLKKLTELAALETSAQLAQRILDSGRITLATAHVSGVNDIATARQNIVDAAAGRPAARSAYGNAPGGTIELARPLLEMLLDLAEKHAFSVSEIAGGSHSQTSRHYKGVAFDVNVMDGVRVSSTNPNVPGFVELCKQLGATEVLGPGDPDHDTHVHVALPRPA